MYAPEYYEHVRLRDIYQKDLLALKAAMETVNIQRRVLSNVVALRSAYPAMAALDTAIVRMGTMATELQREIDRHTQGITEAVTA